MRHRLLRRPKMNTIRATRPMENGFTIALRGRADLRSGKKPRTAERRSRSPNRAGVIRWNRPTRYVYYLNKSNSALWRVPVTGGEELQLAGLGADAQFTLGTHGIYFLESIYATTLKFMDYRTGSIKVAGTLPGPMIHGMTVSPDEH